MNAMEPEQFTLADTPMTDVAEGDANLVPADASSSPPTVPPDVAPEAGSDNVSSLVQILGAPSIDELEKIIGELQQARTYLKSESERIERETVGYTELSQTAMESVRRAETVGNAQGRPSVRSTHGRDRSQLGAPIAAVSEK
jgi:hypothetical protein